MKHKRPITPFSKNLNALLKERGLSVRGAAKLAGVNTSTLQSWRAGAIPENFLGVKKLAEELGTTMSFLLTGQNDGRANDKPSIAEVFDDGDFIFDGYAKITIQKIIPKNKK